MRKISRRPGHRSGNAGHRRRVHTLAGPHRSVSKLAALAAIQRAREASLHRKSRRLLWALPLTFDPGSDRTTLGRHAAIPPERHHQWRFASCHEVQDSSLRNVVRTGRSDAQFLVWEFAPLPRFESQHDPARLQCCSLQHADRGTARTARSSNRARTTDSRLQSPAFCVRLEGVQKSGLHAHHQREADYA